MSEQITILIVDDEPDILEFLKYNFEQKDYNVLTAKNGLKAIKLAQKHLPEIIILDIMMPKLDGLETCRILRENKKMENTYILFLTAKNDDATEIAGFEAGGDDFISKPIRIRTLMARVEALLNRRNKSIPTKEVIKIDDFVIDTEKRKIILDEKEIKLPKLQFKLLSLLASHPERVFTRDEIYNKIWGHGTIVGDRTLDVHIRNIRKKIGNDYIHTTKGVGYSFKNSK